MHPARVFLLSLMLTTPTWAGKSPGEVLPVKAPEDQEVCFSPDEPCTDKLLMFVDSARQSIDVAIYDINLDKLVQNLMAKAKQMKVRVVVDRRQAKGAHSLVTQMVSSGITVRYGHQRGIMHNKFIIIDGKMVESGSFNYTHHAAMANQENQLYMRNPGVVERYQQRFEKIWADASPALPEKEKSSSGSASGAVAVPVPAPNASTPSATTTPATPPAIPLK